MKMSERKKVFVFFIAAAIIIIAIVSINVVRVNIAQSNVEEFEQEKQHIYDYRGSYGIDPVADKSLLTEAMLYDKSNYKAHLLYAEELHNESKYDDALTFYHQAIAIAPDSIDGYWYRSQCYATLKKYDQAINDMTRCIKIEPGRYSYYFMQLLKNTTKPLMT